MAANLSSENIKKLFNFSLPSRGVVLLVGSPSSGVREYVDSLRAGFRLRGGQFATDLTYNSVVGSAPGYVGSDKPSVFLDHLNRNQFGQILIEGVEDGGGARLSDFLSMLKSGSIRDQTGNLADVNISGHLFVFTLYERITSDTSLSPSSLKERISRLRNSNGAPAVPQELLEMGPIIHFFDLLDRPEVFLEKASALGAPSAELLAEATREFYLTNREIFEIAGQPLAIKRENGQRILVAGDKDYRIFRVFSKKDLGAFVSSLDGYHGQALAVENFKNALALKIRLKKKRPVSLFCVGPPGVGKTEIAKRLGTAVGGFLRIDGNVIERPRDLFGASGIPGKLTQGLTKGEPAVILFDEVEKMSKETLLSLLQLLDEGIVNDQNLKETWVLQESIIVFTSNAIRESGIVPDRAREILYELFPQEFIDRINFIVPFHHMDQEHKYEIAKNLAAETGVELTDDQLNQAASSASIRQIELTVQGFVASYAAQEMLDDLENEEELKVLEEGSDSETLVLGTEGTDDEKEIQSFLSSLSPENSFDKNRQLQIAVSSGRYVVTRHLLLVGADPHWGLTVAVPRGDNGMIKLLLEGDTDVSGRWDLLLAAIDNKHKATLDLLIEKGCDVNWQEGRPLLEAFRQDNLVAVKEFLSRGADPLCNMETLVHGFLTGVSEIIEALNDCDDLLRKLEAYCKILVGAAKEQNKTMFEDVTEKIWALGKDIYNFKVSGPSAKEKVRWEQMKNYLQGNELNLFQYFMESWLSTYKGRQESLMFYCKTIYSTYRPITLPVEDNTQEVVTKVTQEMPTATLDRRETVARPIKKVQKKKWYQFWE